MSVEQITRCLITKDQEINAIRNRAISGNRDLLNDLIQAINNLLINPSWHHEAYSEINQLSLTAQPHIIAELDNKVFGNVAEKHIRQDLDNYIIFWKRLFPGSGPKIDYPNINKTLQRLKPVQENRELPHSYLEYEKQFENNMEELQEKRVEFFEDVNDSFITESMDENMLSEIIEMDLKEIKEIREVVEQGPIDELTAEEYLKKMQNFLSLKPTTLSKQLSTSFNREILWAKQYVENYQEYLSNGSCYLYKYFSNASNQFEPKPPKKQNPIHQHQHQQINQADIDFISLKADQQVYNEHENKNRTSKRLIGYNMNRGTYQQKNVQEPYTPIDEFKKQNVIDKFRKTVPNYEAPREEVRYQKNYETFGGKNQQNRNVEYRVVTDQSHDDKKSSQIFRQHRENKTENQQQFPLQDFQIIKHGRTQGFPSRPHEDQIMPQFILTPDHNKGRINNTSQYTPGTAFPNKRGTNSSSKKLSEFKNQKKKRKMGAPLDQLIPIEDYVLRPYSQHFNELHDFSRFRRNCLEDNFTLYASDFLAVNCNIKHEGNSKLRIQITYCNQCEYNLLLETVYRIPKCFSIQKKTRIHKRFPLTDETEHIFTMEMKLFPLQCCLLNLKYKMEIDSKSLSQQNPAIIPLPITIRNCLEFLMVSPEQWKRTWAKLTETPNHHRLAKHIILDKMVINDDELENGLKQFVHVGSVEGYSADEFGALCRHISYHKMVFLLRISVRVDNILTLELMSDRKIEQQDEMDFLEYCLSVWGMLFSRIDDCSML